MVEYRHMIMHVFANYNTASLHDSAFFEVSVAKYFQGRDHKLLHNKVDETTPGIPRASSSDCSQ